MGVPGARYTSGPAQNLGWESGRGDASSFMGPSPSVVIGPVLSTLRLLSSQPVGLSPFPAAGTCPHSARLRVPWPLRLQNHQRPLHSTRAPRPPTLFAAPPRLANPNRARGARAREREHPWKASAKGARPTAPTGPPPAGSAREVSRAEPAALALAAANLRPLGTCFLVYRLNISGLLHLGGDWLGAWVWAVCHVRVWGFSGDAARCGDLVVGIWGCWLVEWEPFSSLCFVNSARFFLYAVNFAVFRWGMWLICCILA